MTIAESPTNAWRQETPGAASWSRTIRADDPNKLFVVSADCHANEPASYLSDYIEPEYLERIPRLEVRPDGSQWTITEGNRPMMVRPSAMCTATRATTTTASTTPPTWRVHVRWKMSGSCSIRREPA